MARFMFPLETVLRQRKNTEHIAQRDAAVVRQALVDLQIKLQKLDRDVKAVADDMRKNHLVGSIDLNLLTAHRRYVIAMERSAVALARNIAEAQAKVDKARTALIHAAREHKVIQTLKDKQWETWLAEQHQRESADLDEAGMQIAFTNLSEASTDDTFARPEIEA